MTELTMLSDTEAAFFLGITKELLYAYIRYAPKKHLGHDRKLATVVEHGKNFFHEKELVAFDNYLKEPWSEPLQRRPAIPSFIQDYLKAEIAFNGGSCPISNKGYPLDNAHIQDYASSLNHHHHNLIRISKEEHTKIDNGIIDKSILFSTKQQLIGNIRNQLKRKRKNENFNPPNPNSVFFGRDLELLQTVSTLEFTRFVIIQGIGGIGKTQLLLNALDNVRYDHPVIWLDIETIITVSSLKISIANAIKESFDVNANDAIISSLKPLTATLIFDSLERMMIAERDEILDFIRDIYQHAPLIQIIITSQFDLSALDCGQSILKIEGLAKPFSEILLNDFVQGTEISDTEMDWLLKFCNGHPLCLKLVSSLINFYKSTQRAIKSLEDGRSVADPLRNRVNKTSSLDICLESAFICLGEEELEIIYYLITFPAGAKYIRAENKLAKNFDDAIGRLLQFFFVELKFDSLEDERISVPNPLIPFLSNKFLDEHNFRTRQIDIFEEIMVDAVLVDVKYLENQDTSTIPYGLMRLENELPNILNAFHESNKYIERFKNEERQQQPYLKIVSGIANALGKFCFLRGYFNFGKLFSQAGFKSSLNQDDTHTAVTNLMYLHQIQLREFDLKAVTKTVQKLKELASQTSDAYAQSNYLWAKGNVSFFQNDYKGAREDYQQAVGLLNKIKDKKKTGKFFTETIDSTKGNIAILNFEIAKTYEFMGDFEQAIELHKKAIHEQQKIKNITDLGSCYNHLAFCYLSVGNFPEGLSYSEKAIESFIKIGQYEYLGNSISDLGRFVEFHPSLVHSKFITENAIILCFENLLEQIVHYVDRSKENVSSSSIFQTVPIELIGKIILTAQVVSLTTFSLRICQFTQLLIETLGLDMRENSLFHFAVSYIHNIGGYTAWKDQKNCDQVLVSTLRNGLILNGGPDIYSRMRIFHWLAVWMIELKIDPTATAQKLFDRAKNSLTE